MTQFVFGSGTLILKRTDVANTPPALLGTLQDISVDFDRKIESLLGQYNVAVALAGGELKISGTAKFARFQATQFNNLFLGQTLTASAMLEMTTGEAGTIPSSSAYTVSVANAATFTEDLGVFYTATGVQMTPVASGPTVGQYSVASGVYTFAAADEGLGVTIYYAYTTTGSGNKIAMANQLMGAMPTFELNMKQSFTYLGSVKDLVLKLNACSSSKIALAFANSKFAIPQFDFQAQADASNNIGTLSLSE